MKLQIISKLVKNQPQASPAPSHRNNHQSRPNLHPKAPFLNIESEYFTKGHKNMNQDHLQNNRSSKVRGFFDHFQTHCKDTYETVIIELPEVRRQLTPMLQSLKSTPIKCSPKDQYQFSFKKNQSNSNILRSKNLNTQTIDSQSKNHSNYYIQQANKTKIKLRKFNSLIQIKNQEKTVIHTKNSNQIPTKRNLSLSTKEGNFIQLFTKQPSKADLTRHHTQNAEQIKQNSAYRCDKLRQSIKTQSGFQEQKERLNRIRKQLNQIYQMKKASEVRLRLY